MADAETRERRSARVPTLTSEQRDHAKRCRLTSLTYELSEHRMSAVDRCTTRQPVERADHELPVCLEQRRRRRSATSDVQRRAIEHREQNSSHRDVAVHY